MLAFAADDDGAGALRQVAEEGVDAGHHLVVERVAFLRAVQPQDRDRSLLLGGK